MISDPETVTAFVDVLKPLVRVERQAETIGTHDAYLRFREEQKPLNDRVLGTVRAMVVQIPDVVLDDMQELYAVLLDHPDLVATVSDRVVTGAILNEAWGGLHGWKK
ncbi:MAG: hypothetical protein ABF876_19390 [Acetobacter aceti]|uniref:Uncharacterized protein n=1 Tax=Komagataeibacter saccharivorans TaxID=265959 RepID=A0A347WH28_9PROT|nr:hypothetical protein [Komagataeibacter saccharivorans]AXY24171.1 hypothetical protein CD178_03427 [Komagataeibacter saccharivorans]MBL7238340.1 hypothetical protein [Novacetimonas hansenii]PYD49643.1 hypothetical protein CFR79_13535 [Komagataeibacter saccharivorans]GBQ41822.1 hypothetical protein AA0614_2454 [Komagataeibacter saccharivorans NRIC 0614]